MSIVIRRAALTDITRIVELAIESVSRNPLPLMIDRGAMTETALDLIKGGQHFARVAEVDGHVVGALGACTQPGFWHQRSTCSVLMFFATVAGAGLASVAADAAGELLAADGAMEDDAAASAASAASATAAATPAAAAAGSCSTRHSNASVDNSAPASK
jgi:hypothetical protein